MAKLLSSIFGPTVWPVTLLALILKTGLTKNQIIILLPILLFFQVFIPYTYIFIAYKRKKISDLDISKRSERYRILIITFFSLLVSLIFIYLFGNQLLFKLGGLILILLFINMVITFFWKISLHMALNVAAAILINFLYHWQLPILYISIPIIFWSRLKLKKHTPAQLLAALVVNTGVILFTLRFIHLP